MGHQDYFLAPLPGSEALLVSGIGKGNFYYKCCFYFCLLLYFIMETSPFESLFRNATTTATVIDNPHPVEVVPFKMPMGIVERVMDNRYEGDGTVHPGDHLLFIHELCELFKYVGISMENVKRKLFSEELQNGISCSRMAALLAGM